MPTLCNFCSADMVSGDVKNGVALSFLLGLIDLVTSIYIFTSGGLTAIMLLISGQSCAVAAEVRFLRIST